MRILWIGTAALLMAGSAGAQVLGGGVGGAVGGLGAGVSGDVVGAVGAPTVGDAIRGAADTVNGAAGAAGSAARATGDTAAGAAAQGGSRKRVRVAAGASIRVSEGTRCYYDDYYFDPVYRDGYYYCERTGPGVAARVKAGR